MTRRTTGGERPPGWDNNPIGQQDLMTRARRALGLQRAVEGHVDPNYNLSIQALDLELPEYAMLSRARLAAHGNTIAAVAGQNPWVAITCPTGSIAVITNLTLGNGGAAPTDWLVGLQTVQPAAGVLTPGVTRDSRLVATTAAQVTGGTSAAAVTPAIPQVYTVPGNTCFTVPETWVVSAGQFLVAVSTSVNFVAHYALGWRERSVIGQEL